MNKIFSGMSTTDTPLTKNEFLVYNSGESSYVISPIIICNTSTEAKTISLWHVNKEKWTKFWESYGTSEKFYEVFADNILYSNLSVAANTSEILSLNIINNSKELLIIKASTGVAINIYGSYSG